MKIFLLNTLYKTFFYGFLITAITFMLYLTSLGLPVFMDQVTASWLGVDDLNDLKMVMEFNVDVKPLPMKGE